MAIHDKFFTGSSVSRYLSPGEHSWDEAVYQSGKPVLDAELNLSQEVNKQIRSLIQNRECPSGWLRGPTPDDPGTAFDFPASVDGDFVANAFRLQKRTALVANKPVVVEYANTVDKGWNQVDLSAATLYDGSPPTYVRTDFVFLEVFEALVSHSPRATATLLCVDPQTIVAGDDVDIGGVVLTSVAGAPGVNEFQVGATANDTAANIRDAVNLATNGFTAICTAQVDVTVPNQVNLRAADAVAGAAGNGMVLTPSGAWATASGAFAGGADTPNKPTQTTIYRHGNTQAPAGVNLVDRIADPTIGTESTKRVQTQYRIRATGAAEGVNFKTENGFSNNEVEAQGAQAAPVNKYRFVPADGVSVAAYIEVLAAPLAVGDVITINGNDLTGVGVPRTPGSDNFDTTGLTVGALATEIAAAINDAANAFAVTVSASAAGGVVTLSTVASGTYTPTNITLSATTTPAGNIHTAVSSAVSYDTVDPGLFIAGDGTAEAAADLATVDGYVYAIPISFVFRRNDASTSGGFDPLANSNGALAYNHALFTNTHQIGTIPANISDRPDRNFHDAIVAGDVLDLRRHVSPGGIDLKAELERQMTFLLDGATRTWAINASDKNELGAGRGDVSSVFLVCNEIGRSAAKGAVAPGAGDTTRGDSIANYDHVRRRFADQAVVERRIFPILPTDLSAAQPGKYVIHSTGGTANTWEEGDIINIDLSSLDATGLGNWNNAPSDGGAIIGGGAVSALWPSGTTISDVLVVHHDDGNYNALVDQAVEVDQILGLGTDHVEIKLASNNRQVTGGLNVAAYDLVGVSGGADDNSPRAIWVELEITYPIGSGTTDTPDQTLSGNPLVPTYYESAIEDDTSQQPDDWEDLLPPKYRQGYREIASEYVCNDGSGAGSGTPLTIQVVSVNNTDITLPRRIFGSKSTVAPTLTDQVDTLPRDPNAATTEYGSSSRLLTVDPAGPNGLLSGAGSTLVSVAYYPQDPLPNWGTNGYQIACYYRSNAPQTVGIQAGAPASIPLPTDLKLRPLAMSRDLWSGTVSVGSVDLPFPYFNPSDQIAVSGDFTVAEFPAEWILSATSNISVGDFSAATGLLNLHQMVPVDGNPDFTFSSLDIDNEFRASYKVADLNAYRPTAMAQPLSGVARHKVWMPFLARSEEDTVYFRKDEVLLIVLSRYAEMDADNTILFTTGNPSCAAVYRTSGLLILASE